MITDEGIVNGIMFKFDCGRNEALLWLNSPPTPEEIDHFTNIARHCLSPSSPQFVPLMHKLVMNNRALVGDRAKRDAELYHARTHIFDALTLRFRT
jgi:hypothetical protein